MYCTINAESHMTGMALMVEFDHDYLTVQSCQYTGTWSVHKALRDVTDGSTGWIAEGCPITNEAEGGNSTIPIIIQYGEEGTWYTTIQLATQPATGYTTNEGIMLGGNLFRIRYEVKAVPQYNRTMPVIIHAPILGCMTDHTYYPEENITIIDGAVIFDGLGDEPVVTEAPIVTEAPVVTEAPTPTGDNPVTWSGDTVYQTNAQEGDQFNWYLNISENSCLNSGEVFVDYMEDYLLCTDMFTNDFEKDMDLLGSWIDWYNEEEGEYPEGSAIPIFLVVKDYACTANYADLIPGEMIEGQIYNRLGLAMQKYMEEYGGLQWGGKLARMTYQWKTIPAAGDPGVMQDENGYYLPMHIVHSYTRPYQEEYPEWHNIDPELVTVVDGKIYFTPATPAPTTYTVTFVDGLTNEVIATQEVEEGNAATAPAVPEHEGYEFIGWDVDFSNITSDLTVTAQYEEVIVPPAEYQLVIYYLRWSDGLQDWVAAQSAYTTTIIEGEAYDVANQIPETIGEYVLDHVEGATSGIASGNVEINAYYVIPAPTTYTVTFVDGLTNEVIATQEVEEGTAATAPAAPEHEGYNFVGWDVDFSNITSDLTVTALYEEIPYEPVAPTVAGLTAELREREEGDTTADIRFIFKVTFNDSFINYEGTVYGPTTEYFEITKMWSVLNAGGKPLNVNGKNIWTMADDSYTYTATLINIPAARFGATITATPYIIYSGVEATGDALTASVDGLLN